MIADRHILLDQPAQDLGDLLDRGDVLRLLQQIAVVGFGCGQKRTGLLDADELRGEAAQHLIEAFAEHLRGRAGTGCRPRRAPPDATLCTQMAAPPAEQAASVSS